LQRVLFKLKKKNRDIYTFRQTRKIDPNSGHFQSAPVPLRSWPAKLKYCNWYIKPNDF
jgi:hypothetical protein